MSELEKNKKRRNKKWRKRGKIEEQKSRGGKRGKKRKNETSKRRKREKKKSILSFVEEGNILLILAFQDRLLCRFQWRRPFTDMQIILRQQSLTRPITVHCTCQQITKILITTLGTMKGSSEKDGKHRGLTFVIISAIILTAISMRSIKKTHG